MDCIAAQHIILTLSVDRYKSSLVSWFYGERNLARPLSSFEPGFGQPCPVMYETTKDSYLFRGGGALDTLGSQGFNAVKRPSWQPRGWSVGSKLLPALGILAFPRHA